MVWYAREVRAAGRVQLDRRLLLHFRRWTTGRPPGSTASRSRSTSGHTPFEADVTHALRSDGENVLIVRAEDPSRDVTIPRGKQYWKEQSESIFYTRTTGVWQTVWLEPVSRSRISSPRLTPDVDSASLRLEVEILGCEPGMTLRAVASFAGETMLDDRFTLRSPLLDRMLPLLPRGEERRRTRCGVRNLRISSTCGWNWRAATVRSTTQSKCTSGMRKIETRNGVVYLNNRPYFQRLVLDQGYFPQGVLTAPTDDDLKRDIELSKEMGFNGARKHQKVEDPRWHYWADQLGFLVWGETANAYEYSPAYVARITREWQDAVQRDYNHPCIVAWTPMNESWGVPNLGTDRFQVDHLLTMYHLTRSLDQSRPVISNDGWEHALTDLCTIHDYRLPDALAQRYATPASSVRDHPDMRPVYCPGFGYRGEPILITEFGGVAFQRDEDRGWGYTTVSDAEEFLKRYDELVAALMSCEPVWGFCHTAHRRRAKRSTAC
ncbi:MAG: glycoside hydrolase family 2 TIM barrel-domain containing protein [Chloroflexia bacterium]